VKTRTTPTQGCTRDIHFVNITISVGGKILIQNSNLSLNFGRKYGLVGKNGVGKTTLLRHISGRELPIPSHISVLHVEQEVIGDDTTVLQSVLSCDVERESLLQEERQILQEKGDKSDIRLAQIYSKMAELEVDKAEPTAAAILAGLGFTPEMQKRPTKEFSGGWRMRISLARALFCDPDILLLDEPTNMLDVKAVVWLEHYLQRWPKTLLVVSHDREFLNEVATDIIHLNAKVLTSYKGNYESFVKARCERLQNQTKLREAQEIQKKHIQRFIDRFRYNAKRASLVQSRIKLLQKMEVIPDVIEDPTLSFSFPQPEALHPPLIQMIDVTFGYTAEKILFRNLNFNLDFNSRIALIGPNGMGKTTLLKIIAGDVKPIQGDVIHHSRLRLAKFSQHHVEQLDLTLSPVKWLEQFFPGHDQQYYRSHLGRYGLSADLALQKIEYLSGGQKSRLIFARIGMQNPHFMLLDEPVNHLDIETVDVLAQALNDYTGGFILVSHDERLINMCCDELWVVDNGQVQVWPGDFASYKQSCLKEFNFAS
jgi:ATP-binding cassette subfamily F protein 3